MKFIESFRIWPFFYSTLGIDYSKEIIMMFDLILNILLITYVLMRFSLEFTEREISYSQWVFWNSISSFFFKIYQFVLLIPTLDVCFSFISDPNSANSVWKMLSILNIGMIILFAAIANYHDFDYSYVLKDQMAKKESFSTMVFLLEDIIMVILFNI